MKILCGGLKIYGKKNNLDELVEDVLRKAALWDEVKRPSE